MANLKARDIVRGWPRGRSSVVLWPDWECGAMFFFQPMTEKRKAREAELGQERDYHARQQDMVNRVFENWRNHKADSARPLPPIDQLV
jgi:hypothetical protein